MTEERREAARQMADMAAAAQRGEATAAQRIIDDFVVRAKEQSLPTQPLVATQLNGRTVKTDKVGWYVNKKRTLAIGEDGSWYKLTVPSAAMARFTGVKLQASPPELVVGRGARDGESGDLTEFLERLLKGQ